MYPVRDQRTSYARVQQEQCEVAILLRSDEHLDARETPARNRNVTVILPGCEHSFESVLSNTRARAHR